MANVWNLVFHSNYVLDVQSSAEGKRGCRKSNFPGAVGFCPWQNGTTDFRNGKKIAHRAITLRENFRS